MCPRCWQDGWLIEQVWRDRQPVYIYGAGHVGQALARVLAPLPQFKVNVVDVRADLFGTCRPRVRPVPTIARRTRSWPAPRPMPRISS